MNGGRINESSNERPEWQRFLDDEPDEFANDEFAGEAVDGEFSSDESADASVEGSYVCDNCGEDIVIPLDIAAGRDQEYVEDCPVCCSPNLIRVHFDDEDQADVRAEAEQDRY